MTPQHPQPALGDEYVARLEPAAAEREQAELDRLAADPLRGLGSGIPTPAFPVRHAA